MGVREGGWSDHLKTHKTLSTNSKPEHQEQASPRNLAIIGQPSLPIPNQIQPRGGLGVEIGRHPGLGLNQKNAGACLIFFLLLSFLPLCLADFTDFTGSDFLHYLR